MGQPAGLVTLSQLRRSCPKPPLTRRAGVELWQPAVLRKNRDCSQTLEAQPPAPVLGQRRALVENRIVEHRKTVPGRPAVGVLPISSVLPNGLQRNLSHTTSQIEADAAFDADGLETNLLVAAAYENVRRSTNTGSTLYGHAAIAARKRA